MRSLFLIFFICWVAVMSAQNMMRFNDVPKGQLIYIYRYQEADFIKVDSINVQQDSMRLEVSTSGLYGFRLKRHKNMAEILINKEESGVYDFLMNDLSNGYVSVFNSDENLAYKELIAVRAQYYPILDTLLMLRKSIDIYEDFYFDSVVAIDREFEQNCIKLNSKLTYLQFRYPTTFAVKSILPTMLMPVRSKEEKEQYQTPYAYLNNYFFKYIPDDNSLLNHYALDEKITDYLIHYVSPGLDGISEGMKNLVDSFSEKGQLKASVHQKLLEKLLELKNETLLTNYLALVNDGCEIDLGVSLKKKLENYQKTMEGGVVDDIIMRDLNGKLVSLKNTVEGSKYTILVFWSSWCVHCKEFIPELNETYKSLKRKGLSVFAVSLDESEQEFKEFVNEHSLKWVNVAELVPIRQAELPPKFSVTTTPTLFLLDRDGIILKKNIFGEQLNQELSRLFNH